MTKSSSPNDMHVARDRHVSLEAPRREFFPKIFDWIIDPAATSTWRTRGRSFSANDLERILFENVHSLRIIVECHSGEPIGIAELSSYSSIDQYADLGLLAFPPFRGTGLVIEGAIQFLDQCFSTMPLRKVYFTVSRPALDEIGDSLHRIASVEGTLSEHILLNGRFEDVTIFAFTPMHLRRWRESSRAIASLSAPRSPGSGAGSVIDLITEVQESLSVELADDDPRPLDWDSLSRIEIQLVIENHLRRELPMEVLDSLRSTADLLALLRSLTP